MPEKNVTRGYGLFESFLAKKRASVANGLIPFKLRKGRILDIGCGVYPYFLRKIDFFEKYGLDQIIDAEVSESSKWDNLHLKRCNIEIEPMPFDPNFFDVVTLLAVFEHIDPEYLTKVISDIHKVLKPGGIFIMSTPAPWTDRLLRIMAGLKLVSSEEIEEHKDAYSHKRISSMLVSGGFQKEKLNLGYFELFMNIWATGIK